jgi:cyanophycinase
MAKPFRSFLHCIGPLFSIAALLLGLTVAHADENPFGLPRPDASARLGSVMLHGGGSGLKDEIRQEFVRLAGGRDARILLMPSDMCQFGKTEDGQPIEGGETVAAYERRLATPAQYGRWVALRESGRVADFQFLCRDTKNDQDNARFYALLEKATGIWLPAYDQEWLPTEFANRYPKETSRFQLALRGVIARGGVVGGLGGGMACLPETIIARDVRDGDGWVRAETRFGLALLNGVIVDQNFSSHAGRLERLADLLRNGRRLDRLEAVAGVERRTIGLGVERYTVLILRGNTIRALGEGRGHVFLKSNGSRTITWQTLAPGEDPLVVQASSVKPPSPALASESSVEVVNNPLGMPEPNDPSHLGTVILHGGGDTGEIIDLLPELAGVAKPRLVHCPAARESCRPSSTGLNQALVEHLERTFAPWRMLQTEGRLADLTFVTTNESVDANRPDFVAPLRWANAMWFCGGDQEPLARLFVDPLRPTLFQQELCNIVRRGGVVGGTSAGLAIMADVMIEGGQSEDGRPAEAHLSRGIGVLTHVLAEQHFDARQGRIERLTGLLRDHKRLANFSPTCKPKTMIGMAVEEDTALILQANRLRVTGRKLAHIFLQWADPRIVTWHALVSGDAAILRQGRNECRLELEDWVFGE